MGNHRVIYLVRHGALENPNDIIYGRTIDLPLSSEGSEQITKLSAKIFSIDPVFMRIITSPLLRTRETAQILSGAFEKSSIEIDDRLIETDCGKLDGAPLSLFLKQHIDAYQEPMRALYGVEAPQMIMERMYAVFISHLSNDSGPWCMVSHGDPLAFLMWKMTHFQESSIPSDADIKKWYLRTGECWRMLINADGSLQSFDHIIP